MDTTQLHEHRQAKDEVFRSDHHSPVAHRSDFAGLNYFAPNSDLVFNVKVEPADGSEIRIPTSDEREKVYVRAGRVKLDVGGAAEELTLFDTGHPGLFLPFRDATSGETTYGAGRYLDLDLNSDGTVDIDFNYAYNPMCVYSDGYSCPIPPVENWMKVPIEAGEKNYP